MNGSNLSENKQQKLYKYTERFWLLVSMIRDLLQEIERGSISRLHEESLTTTIGTYMEVKSNSKWRSTIYHWFRSTVQIVPIYLLVIVGTMKQQWKPRMVRSTAWTTSSCGSTKFGEPKPLSLYHRWIQIFLSPLVWASSFSDLVTHEFHVSSISEFKRQSNRCIDLENV